MTIATDPDAPALSPTGPGVSPADGEELLPLPPLDDDGESFATEVPLEALEEPVSDGAGALEDQTSEDDPIEAWLDRHTMDASRAYEQPVPTDDETGGADDAPFTPLFGAESGWVGSDLDEPDGTEVSPEEAGLVDDVSPYGDDDGGVEGTGEDPALSIRGADPLGAWHPPDAESDDDTLADEALFEAHEHARLRRGLERDTWPPRADVAWTLEAPRALDGGVPQIATRARIADRVFVLDFGLRISTDEGTTWTAVGGCEWATAMAPIPGTPSDKILVVALHDELRDWTALAVVRFVAGKPIAEIIVDFGMDDVRPLAMPSPFRPHGEQDDGGPSACVDAMIVRTLPDGTVEVTAYGGFGVVCLRS